MISPQQHLTVQRSRVADLQREARRHPLAGVHPVERRQAIGRLGRWLARRPSAVTAPVAQS